MISKNQLKSVRSLHVSKYRRKEKKFIAEGPKIVNEFLNSSYEIDTIYALAEWIEANEVDNTITVVEITPKELQFISLLKAPNQVFALVNYPESKHLGFEQGELILALDTIQDPGNLGTIIRIADWFGISKVICSIQTADAYNPKVVQASMGAITRVKFEYTELKEWLVKLPKDTNIYGALLDGDNIYKADLQESGIIVIGNESKGIRPEIQNELTHRIKIPPYGDSLMESLNAAVATALICGEFRRGK